jgi:hypothetical protein
MSDGVSPCVTVEVGVFIRASSCVRLRLRASPVRHGASRCVSVRPGASWCVSVRPFSPNNSQWGKEGILECLTFGKLCKTEKDLDKD